MNGQQTQAPRSALLEAVQTPNAIDEVMAETEVRRWAAQKEQAEAAFRSGYLPNHVRSLEAARAIVMAGAELGLPAMTSFRVIYFFDGKIALAASLMQALAYKRVPGFRLDILKTSEAGAWIAAMRPGMTEPAKVCFTMEDAQRAQLLNKDNWKKYPKAMCLARAIAMAVRAVAPEAVLGVLATEEVDGPPIPWDRVYPEHEQQQALQAPEQAPQQPAQSQGTASALKEQLRGKAGNGNGGAKATPPKRDPAAPPPGFDQPAPAAAKAPKPELPQAAPSGVRTALDEAMADLEPGTRFDFQGHSYVVEGSAFGKIARPLEAHADREPGDD